MAKKGQYFTMDAFMALFVITTGLLIVLSFGSYRPVSEQPQILSQEFVNVLAQSKIKQVNAPFISQQVAEGTITDTDNTILQQAYEYKFFFDSDVGGYNPTISNLSAQFLESVSQNLIPKQYNFEIIIDDDVVYNRGPGFENTDLLVSTKRLAFGVYDKTTEFWGPIIVEVRLWQ